MKFNYLTHNRVSHSTSQGGMLLISILFILSVIGCKPTTEKSPIKAPPKTSVKVPTKPIAVETYIKPSKNFPKGHYRIEYQFGVLRISKEWHGYSKVSNHRVFVNLNTAWPDFGGKKYYSKSEHVDKIRLLFEAGEATTPFKNLYHVMMKDKEDGLIEASVDDRRFNGLIGYKLKREIHFSLYQVTDETINNVMSTPLVIWCTGDHTTGQDMISNQGSCRYNLIMDPALSIQIRFNKPHLKNFIALHRKVMHLINTIRTVK